VTNLHSAEDPRSSSDSETEDRVVEEPTRWRIGGWRAHSSSREAKPALSWSRRTDIAELARGSATNFRSMLEWPQPHAASVADIWTTVSAPPVTDTRDVDAQPRIVVILEGASSGRRDIDRMVSVAPISVDTVFATNFDLVVTAAASPLPFAFMVEAWNEMTAVEARLDRCLGALGPSLRTSLERVRECWRAGLDPASIGLRNVIGPQLLGEDDPRLAFQERERIACEYLQKGKNTVRRNVGILTDRDDASPPPEVLPGWTVGDAVALRTDRIRIRGSAIRTARMHKSWTVSDLRAAIVAAGSTVDTRWIFNLEQDKVGAVTSELAALLAGVLEVAVSDIERTAPEEEDDVVRVLRLPRITALLVAWAGRLGMNPDELSGWVTPRLQAAPRRASGEMDAKELEEWLIALLQTRVG